MSDEKYCILFVNISTAGYPLSNYKKKKKTSTNDFIYRPTVLADFCETFLNIVYYLLTALPISFHPSGFPIKILHTFVSPVHNTGA